jgi:ATP-dependent DNA helicase RecQ
LSLTIPTTTVPSENAEPNGVRAPAVTPAEFEHLPVKLQWKVLAWLRIDGKANLAAELLEGLFARTGASAAWLDERSAQALARGDLAAVRASWRERLEQSPAASARAGYARALLELGEIEEAAAIIDALLLSDGELATVQSLAAEIALQQGDVAAAYEYWSGQLSLDAPRIAALLALTRIALLSGDGEEARATLARAVADPTALTPAQLVTAAGLADLLAQPARSHALRVRYARLEAERIGALAAEIDAALGRDHERQDHLPAAGRGTPPLPPVNGPQEDPSVALVAEMPPAAEETPDDPRVLETLRAVFGHDGLLPGQSAVINRALAGTSTLAILPTGAGKSLTFQLSSLLLPGITLVLSPLIALMKDQVEGLPPGLREQTVLVNSTLTPSQHDAALRQIASGEAKLVYAAPERLRQQSFLRALRQGGVSLVVVDEAHCISLWGHDFRPDYLSIPASLPELGDPPLLAMTATASPETAAAIGAAFGRELDIVRTSAFRPNLFYTAEKLTTKEDKARRVIALCRELPGQGIVYVSSRRDAENLAGVLNDHGVRAVPYHAGLEPRVRAQNQDRFMQGMARVVVATVAFGMGVDKRDVRFIIHFSPSTSLEAYAQESGRAGRDGLPSRCILLYTAADRANQTRLAQRDAMDLDTLRQVYSGIKRHAVGPWAIFDPSRIVLQGDPGDDPDDLPDPRIGIGLLELGGLLERHPNAPVNWTLTRSREESPPDAPLPDADAEIWHGFAAWAELDRAGDRLAIQTAAACAALDVSPDTLARVLDEQPEWDASEGARFPCLKLLPAGENAGARLQRVIDDAANRARARVDRMMTYAAGRRCRHVTLAAHLGERLPPCGEVCDVCTGEAEEAASSSTRRERQPKKRTVAGDADAIVALKALLTAPFPLGKTGLVRLLEGSIQSRIQADRSPFFGSLADLRKSKIEGLIDELVMAGDLFHDRSGDFPLLRLTPAGRARLHDDQSAS